VKHAIPMLIGVLGWLCLAMPASGQAPDEAPDEAGPAPRAAHSRAASPRAAVVEFRQAMARLGRVTGDEAAWSQVEALLAPSGGTAAERRAAAERLGEVLGKVGWVEPGRLPGAGAVEAQSLRRFVYFPGFEYQRAVWERLAPFGRWPEGRITLAADDSGAWRFTAETLEGIERLAASLEPLPPGAVSAGGDPEAPPEGVNPFAALETGKLAGLMGPSFQRTPWWGWAGLLLAIFAGLAAGKIVQALLRRFAARFTTRQKRLRGRVIDNAASPASLALFTLGLAAGFQFIYLEPPLTDLFWRVVAFLYLLAFGWFAYNLVDVVDLVLRRLTEKTESQLDDQVVPLIRKTLRIFLVIVFALVAAQNIFGLNITGWLAGLGIAGLAISLAAQDSVKNLFGSLTIFFDKPFMVGEYIVFGGYAGTVEEIGFRSTRLRLLSGHLVTVPNMKFIDGDVENISARPHIRREMDVTITYDTPPEKIDEAITILRRILCEHPEVVEKGRFDMEANPPRVNFTALNADSLNIKAYYWYQIDGDPDRGWYSFLEHAEIVNRELFRRYGEAGIDFAVPTQTLYLAGDTGRRLTVALDREG